TSVTIGNSVTSIGDYAFEGCSGLTIVYINDLEAYCNIEFANYNANPVYYAKNLYLNGSLIEDLVIPEGVAKISDYSFRGLNHIKTVTIPNSVTSIGYRAFYGCSGLTSIEIPNSVTSIGGDAFGWCSGLTSVTIGNSVTSIGDYAFESCSGLTSIEIPNSVTSIGDYAFSDCSGLTSVEIGNSVTSIGNYAFYSCESLTSIEIGNSVTSIGKFAFEGCENLTSVVWNVKKCSDFSFSSRPFKNCPNITSFTFGDEVEHIPAYLCYNLSKLTSIQIPNSVTSIGGTAFEGCKSLTSIVIGNSVTSIRDHAFAYCSSLTKITCMATTPPTIESYTFSNYSAKLHVPSGCKSAYKSAIYWKNFNIKEIPTLSTSIALNKTSASLKATETLTLIATVLPENATNKSVTWKSSNEAVATVDANGKVTAVAVGEATITATTADGSNKSATCKITVAKTLATSISLDKTSATLKATETLTLKATVAPATTTDKSVTWTSSNEAVATVDANGKVTAVSVGEATIIATTADGSNLSASCKVTVVPTLGDANNDAVINVTDIMVVASYILGNTPEGFVFEAADVTKDGKINIIDIVAIANIILSSETPDETQLVARVARQTSLGSRLFIDDTSIQEGETMQLAVNLTNDIAFSGFQADVKLPEGLELCQEDGEYMISLSDRKGSDHVLTSAMLPDGTIRILSYSMNLNDFAGADGALVYLTVKATQHFVGDYEISIDNITFTQADLTEYSLEPTVCRIAGTTSIEGVDNNVIVASIGDYIVVKNATAGSVVRVYTADGAMIASEFATEGDVIIEVPAKGIYVVKVGKQTVKVII
ncbi:MAG: leucine-rich repeat protein, partial [Muribaculaceae bacterium]|nr:leucine-rich repeat protein [Muribaculaceae bacterium]